jgi:hypothetical protein
MARRPPHLSREEWLKQRAEVWRRRNRILNVLMLIAIALLLLRYFGMR